MVIAIIPITVLVVGFVACVCCMCRGIQYKEEPYQKRKATSKSIPKQKPSRKWHKQILPERWDTGSYKVSFAESVASGESVSISIISRPPF